MLIALLLGFYFSIFGEIRKINIQLQGTAPHDPP